MTRTSRRDPLDPLRRALLTRDPRIDARPRPQRIRVVIPADEAVGKIKGAARIFGLDAAQVSGSIARHSSSCSCI